jgi:hypothetical protein
MAMGKVDRSGGIPVDRHIAQLRDFASRQYRPVSSVIGSPDEAVAGREINRRGILRIVIERRQKRMVKAGVLPCLPRSLTEEPAWGEPGANHILLRNRHARVERVLSGDRIR